MFVITQSSRLHLAVIAGLAATAFAALAASPSSSSGASAAETPQGAANYGKLPLSFESNQGQLDPQVKFVSRGKGYSLFLTDSAAVLSLTRPTSKPAVPANAVTTDTIQMQLSGASPAMHTEASDQLPGVANYFLGNDPAQWRTNIPTYAKVRYSHVYNGIDLVYYGNQSQLEYDFIVAPNADPSLIRLQFAGARKLTLTPAGELTVTGNNGEIAFHQPVLYQEKDGHRHPVSGRFTLQANNNVSFAVGRYDRAKALIIDPVLTYSTYLGGTNGSDYGAAITVDSSGSTYITGRASSTNFPLTEGAYQLVNNEGQSGANAFITKLNSTGTALVYSTYLGGGSDDDNNYGLGIAVDASGDAYVAGYTNQNNFPTTIGAFQIANAGGANAFVTKLNSGGTGLVYSTYLGGNSADSSGDYANAIAVDASGNAYLTGKASSSNFPVTKGAFQTTNNNPDLGSPFVAKLNAAGSALVYATYLGGSRVGNTGDYGAGIAIDKSGDAYVTGATYATNFPTTFGSYQTVNLGQRNAFVSKLNPAGTALVYSTYLGGNYADQAAAIAVDSSGDVYVTGQAGSSDFPVTSDAFQTKPAWTTLGGSSAFVTKFNPAGTELLYSTYLGGNGEGGFANAITLDSFGDAYLTGRTVATNFPLTSGAYQTTNDAYGGSAFVTKLNPTGSGLLYSTYLSGSGAQGVGGDTGYGIALNPSTGDAYITGQAFSSNFPVTTGAYQTTNRGAAASVSNAFISKLAIGGETTTTLTANANPELQGSTVVFTAKVAADYGATAPTGTVAFTVDGGAATSVTLAAGQATYSTAALVLGKHTIVATYSGGGGYVTSAATYAETISIDTPILSPAAGTYQNTQQITITDATPGTTIYYTTNGTAPTTSSIKYTGPFTLAASTTIEAVAAVTGYPNSAVATVKYTVEVPAATPVFSVAAGTYSTKQTVSITDATAGAVIYYTTNGTTPTTASTKYTAPIAVSATETIEAIAVATGYSNSAVASAKYTIEIPAATPVFSIAAGTYSAKQTVSITDATAGAVLYYTTNGTTPTTASTKYTAPIAVSATETIEAIAVATGYANSAVASAKYTIELPAATPVFSVAAGTYSGAQTVSITDATAGAVLYYTTNGTTPTTASTKYTAPITVSATETIEAIAVATGYINSAVASAKYTIEPDAPTPTITPSAGAYTSAQLVTIADTAANATIYYTTNGTTPTTASTKYTAPFLVSANETVTAIAVLTGDSNSLAAKSAYTIYDWPTGLGAPATAITTSSATLNAFTSTQGIAGTYYFQYGTTSTALTSTTTKTTLNSQPTVQASAALTGLKTKTTYYFQFVVTTPAGSAMSPVLTFTTD